MLTYSEVKELSKKTGILATTITSAIEPWNNSETFFKNQEEIEEVLVPTISNTSSTAHESVIQMCLDQTSTLSLARKAYETACTLLESSNPQKQVIINMTLKKMALLWESGVRE